jgi:hypothetical protein
MENVSKMEPQMVASHMGMTDMESIRKSQAFAEAMADFRSKYAQQGVMEVAVKGQFSPSQGLIACSITPLPPNVQCPMPQVDISKSNSSSSNVNNSRDSSLNSWLQEV